MTKDDDNLEDAQYEPKDEKKRQDFEYCPIHKVPYPKGADCPQCSGLSEDE